MSPVEKLLRVARRRILFSGWQQSKLHSDEGYCALGALGYTSALGHELVEDGVRTEAKAILEAVVGGDQLWCWNDTEGRTREHVIAAFGLAIARAKRRG